MSVENGYTSYMDSVRFGRALGVGARAAAKTLVTAVDAASSPNPSADAGRSAAGVSTTSASSNTDAKVPGMAESKAAVSGARLGQQAARTTTQVLQTRAGLKRGSKRFGEAVWGPFVKLSGVLWLELTGVFFGIFALTAAGAAWRERAGMHEMAVNHERFLWAVVVSAVFAYFCVSSFVSANRRSRGR